MHFSYKGWQNYSFFFSAENTQRFLKKCYQKQNIENAEQKSFENCYSFIYYLEHGQIYYEQAHKSPLLIQPVLLFYGFVHLIKACILTVEPSYPESTSVLAHGVSTRKRKKQNYNFFQDEVRFQKNGLFPFMSEKLFHMEQLEGDKAAMEDLLRGIPELSEMFYLLEGKHSFVTVPHEESSFFLPEFLLDNFHMTKNRFQDFLRSKLSQQVSFPEGERLAILFEEMPTNDISPLKFNLEEQSFGMPVHKTELLEFPELLIHYLLLYNLSMIARYETEWWSELTKMMPNKDYPFIKAFLNISHQKGPFLVFQYLLGLK
ncbi:MULTISPECIES: YaaC family protein [unclassified Bacillus (in: firmicutes)]|uniref:YaaC family protein n=1 Tax=unclassified Bacillus (in: firmicutes) TaxID=185979 RepID=UPI0008E7552C|nr:MULTISPECIES: YaaC family protein [unclassified Bacillus (in: firmicutes)]SFB26511.1 YaaC-like Protein [Bacillus sp. UNCCL13]SFQ91986.1 YaaC-like Protein [Bacillus sp. cl95]